MLGKFSKNTVSINDLKPREYPPMPPPPPCRKNGKSRTYLLWMMEYLKIKHPEDKDMINAIIEVALKEL